MKRFHVMGETSFMSQRKDTLETLNSCNLLDSLQDVSFLRIHENTVSVCVMHETLFIGQSKDTLATLDSCNPLVSLQDISFSRILESLRVTYYFCESLKVYMCLFDNP